jgi:hypothetical protein
MSPGMRMVSQPTYVIYMSGPIKEIYKNKPALPICLILFMQFVCHIHVNNKCTHNFNLNILIVQMLAEKHTRAIKLLIKPFLPLSIQSVS